MLLSDIKERLSRDPFEPFRIRSSGGESHDITSPFLVALMKSKLFIAAPNSDHWAELSYLHVSALESTNGHSRKAPRSRRRK